MLHRDATIGYARSGKRSSTVTLSTRLRSGISRSVRHLRADRRHDQRRRGGVEHRRCEDAGSDEGVQQLLLHIAGVEARTRSSYVVAWLLVRGCARLALHRRLWLDAVRLYAAEKALALDLGLDPEPSADVPAKVTAARAAIGAAAADEAAAAGAAMGVGQALAHAKAWLAKHAD
jgi:hypothetical protein